MKECPKCFNIKNLDDFKDKKLTTGYGRYCNACKKRPTPQVSAPELPLIALDIHCPTCNSKMVLRSRKRDKHQFYGCSRFPKCMGIRTTNLEKIKIIR